MTHQKSIVAGFIAVLFIACSAQAQVGTAGLFKPWEDKSHIASTFDEPMFISGGHTKGDNEDIDIFYWDSTGRIKFDRTDNDPKVWMGYRILCIGIDGDHDNLPGDLTDMSMAFAFKLGEVCDGWNLSLALGAGTANDGHWSNTDAIYGIGTLNAEHKLDADSSLNVGLNYHGNRTFLPDVPLPYATYSSRVNEDFSFYLGLPSSGFTWRIFEPLSIEMSYTVPSELFGRVTVALSKEWSVFGEYAHTLNGFYIEEQDHDRLFYEMSRVTAGVRWVHGPLIDIRLGVGYAFNQEFSNGFDVRDLDTVAEPSDEMMFLLTVQGTF